MFLFKIKQFEKKHDLVFIVDEVQTGLGATGKLWAHERIIK